MAVDDRHGQVDQLAVIVLFVALIGLALSVRILRQYERAVMFHLGKVRDGARGPGLILFAPLIKWTRKRAHELRQLLVKAEARPSELAEGAS